MYRGENGGKIRNRAEGAENTAAAEDETLPGTTESEAPEFDINALAALLEITHIHKGEVTTVPAEFETRAGVAGEFAVDSFSCIAITKATDLSALAKVGDVCYCDCADTNCPCHDEEAEGECACTFTSSSNAYFLVYTADAKPTLAPLDTNVPTTTALAVGAKELTVDCAVGVQVNIPAFNHEKLTVSEMPRVEIQVSRGGQGNVAYIRAPGGGMSLVKESRIGIVIVPVDASCEIVIVDNTQDYNDIEGSEWYADSVTFVTAREIFQGDTDLMIFMPADSMTRAMVAQVMYNYDRFSEAGKGVIAPTDYATRAEVAKIMTAFVANV